MTVHPLTKIAVIVFFYGAAIGAVLFFHWIISGQLQAIAESAVVEVVSGVSFILLPLLIPVLHIMEIFDNKIVSRKFRAIYRKIQNKIFFGSVIIVVGIGFAGTQMVMSKIYDEGYEKCEFVLHQTRAVFKFYSKDPTLCPTS